MLSDTRLGVDTQNVRYQTWQRAARLDRVDRYKPVSHRALDVEHHDPLFARRQRML